MEDQLDRWCSRTILQAAVLAPSPDNNQPWRFSLEGRRLLAYLDPSRALPSDVRSMFSLIALGAAVENACIAARSLGYEAEVVSARELIPSMESGREPFASVTFQPKHSIDSLGETLAQRCTCRRMYSKQSIPDESLQAINANLVLFNGVSLHWITERPKIREFAKIIACTDRIRLEYQPFHEELYRQLRFTATEAEQTRDGLDIRTLELPPGATSLLKVLRSWKVMQTFIRLHFTRALAVPSALAVRASGALGAILLDDATACAFFTGGRALERIWLTANSLGISFHPLGSLPIFLAHHDLLSCAKLPRKQCEVLRSLSHQYRKMIPEHSARTLLMLFRIGFSRAPSARSMRREVDDVVELMRSEHL